MWHHHEQGSGRALALLHGLGISHRAWRPVLPRLAAERRAIAFDLPGCGARDLRLPARGRHRDTLPAHIPWLEPRAWGDVPMRRDPAGVAQLTLDYSGDAVVP